MSEVSKKTIMEFKAGDAAAFDRIYYIYSKKLYRFTLGLVKDHDQSCEIVQQVFVNLWEKREQIDTSLSLENYIFTITYNATRRYFRKLSMERKVKVYLQDVTPVGINGSDENVIYNELLKLANSSIENLPDRRKKVYKLSRQEGLKIKEIASILNISPRTVETHLAKALKFLKEELAAASILTLLFFCLFIS